MGENSGVCISLSMLQPLVIAPQSMLRNTQRVSCPARKGPASAEKQAQRMSDPLLDQGIDSLKNVLVFMFCAGFICQLCRADGVEGGCSRRQTLRSPWLTAKSLLQSFSGQDVK